jgi:hypothetical protein
MVAFLPKYARHARTPEFEVATDGVLATICESSAVLSHARNFCPPDTSTVGQVEQVLLGVRRV